MTQIIPNMPYYDKSGYIQQKPNHNFAANDMQQQAAAIVSENPIMKTAGIAQEDPMKNLLGGVGVTAGLMGISEWLNRGLQGDYANSFLGKIESTVNNFASTNTYYNKFKSIANPLVNKVKGWLGSSEIVKTLLKKPSLGGPQVTQQAAGAMGHLASRAKDILEAYIKEASNPGSTLSLDPATVSALKSKLSVWTKDTYKYADEIIDTIRRTPGLNLKHIISNRPWWGFGLFKNKSNLQEVLNKYQLIKNYKTAGSGLGSKLSGYLFRGAESLTNGLLSGKGQILMQGIWVAMSLNQALKAEKGEKGQVFAESLADLMAITATAGLQMRTMNALAGLKFIGMPQANYAKYHETLKLLNEAAKIGDTAAYNGLKTTLNSLKNYSIKWYQKPLKWLGEIFSFGRINETIKPLKNSSIFAKIPYGLKVGIGFVGRAALIMGVILPIFQNIAKGLSHKIFGKPVKTIEREKQKELEEKMKEEAEMQQRRELMQQQAAMPQQVLPTQNVQPMQNTQFGQQPYQQIQSKPGNLLDTVTKLQNTPPQTIASQPMYGQPTQAIASTEIKSPDAHIKRSYIPNPVLGVEEPLMPATTRTAEIDRVLKQADWAEAQAHKFGV